MTAVRLGTATTEAAETRAEARTWRQCCPPEARALGERGPLRRRSLGLAHPARGD